MRKIISTLLVLISHNVLAQPCTDSVVASFSPNPICSGKPLSLVASTVTGASYVWTGPASTTIATTQNVTIPLPASVHSGRYIVAATVGSCVYRDTLNILVNPTPLKPSLSSNAPMCIGDTLVLHATGGVIINNTPGNWWGPNGYTGSTNPTKIPNAQVTDTGTYYFRFVSLAGCISDTSFIHVDTISPKPAKPQVTGKISYCVGDTIKFFSSSSTPGVNYTWTGVALAGLLGPLNIQNLVLPNAQILHSGYYFAQAIFKGCAVTSDTLKIHVKPTNPPTVSVSASPDTNIIANQTVIFSGTMTNWGPTPTNYRWTVNKAIASSGQGATIPPLSAAMLQDNDQVCLWIKVDSTCAAVDTAMACVTIHIVPIHVNNVKPENSFSVYPNPSSGKFTISSVAAAGIVEIINTLGQILYSGPLVKGINKIDLTGELTPGIYIIKLQSGSEIQTLQLLLGR